MPTQQNVSHTTLDIITSVKCIFIIFVIIKMLETLVCYLRTNKDQNQKGQKKSVFGKELEIREMGKFKEEEKEKGVSGQLELKRYENGNFGQNTKNRQPDQLKNTFSGKQFQKLFLQGISPHHHKSQQKLMEIQLEIKNEIGQKIFIYSENQNSDQSGNIGCQEILSY